MASTKMGTILHIVLFVCARAVSGCMMPDHLPVYVCASVLTVICTSACVVTARVCARTNFLFSLLCFTLVFVFCFCFCFCVCFCFCLFFCFCLCFCFCRCLYALCNCAAGAHSARTVLSRVRVCVCVYALCLFACVCARQFIPRGHYPHACDGLFCSFLVLLNLCFIFISVLFLFCCRYMCA